MTTLRKTALLLIVGALCTILVVVVRFHRSAGPQRVLRREAARRALPRARTNPTTTKQLANPSSAAAAIAPPVNHSMPPARRHTRARARTLVCLIGSARGGEETWRSIHRHLVLPNNADLALFLPEADRNAGALVALATDPSLVFRQREHDDWGDALDGIAAAVHARDARWARAMPAEAGSGDRDPDMEFYARLKAAPNAATTTWRDILRTGRSFAPRAGEGAHSDPKKAREMALSNSGVFGGVYFAGRRLPGSGAIVGAQRHFVSRVLVERGLLERYGRFVVPVEITGICRALFLDWTLRFSQLSISHRLWRFLFSFPRVFICFAHSPTGRTRNDQRYLCDLDLGAMDRRKIWIPLPREEDYGGFCDRFIACSARDIVRCLDTTAAVVAHPGRFMDRRWAFRSPEALLMIRLRQNGLARRVRRFGRTFFTAAAESDKSTWKYLYKTEKNFIADLAVYTKYPREYAAATETCGGRRGHTTAVTAPAGRRRRPKHDDDEEAPTAHLLQEKWDFARRCLSSPRGQATRQQAENLFYPAPDDAQAHFEAIERALNPFRSVPIHTYAKWRGPWLENLWMSNISKLPLEAFKPYIPIFAPWNDIAESKHSVDRNTRARRGWSYRKLVAALRSLLRPNVAYVTLTDRDRGITNMFPANKWHLKNILVLSAGGYGHIPVPLLGRPVATPPHRRRPPGTPAIAFVGNLLGHPVRHGATAALRQRGLVRDGAAVVYHGSKWREVRLNASFALVPRGFGRSAFSIFEAIQMGVIPVYVYEEVEFLPYRGSKHADWDSFGFSFSIREWWERGPETLLRVTAEHLHARERRLRSLIASHFSFEGTLEQIKRFFARGPAGSDLRCLARLPPQACCEVKDSCSWKLGGFAHGCSFAHKFGMAEPANTSLRVRHGTWRMGRYGVLEALPNSEGFYYAGDVAGGDEW